jgi:uncharacterized protein YfkK (UPF0435 family)
MKSIKKSVYISGETVQLLWVISPSLRPNFSGSINLMAKCYDIFVQDNLPVLTDNEKKALYSIVLNFPFNSENLEFSLKAISMLITESYFNNSEVKQILNKQQCYDLIQKSKKWSLSESIAVVHYCRAYLKDTHTF